MTLEDEAKALGDDRKLLERRLRDAASMLNADTYPHFTREVAVFNPYQKRLHSRTLITHYLQWMIRREPDQPIGYQNRQTSRGVVMVNAWYWSVESGDFNLMGQNAKLPSATIYASSGRLAAYAQEPLGKMHNKRFDLMDEAKEWAILVASGILSKRNQR